jgi:DNA-directed RNA polymerase specialized sigma24 family protein
MHTTDQRSGDALERERGRLYAIAYGMLGTTAEAEDVVQEAFARWHEADRSAALDELWRLPSRVGVAGGHVV